MPKASDDVSTDELDEWDDSDDSEEKEEEEDPLFGKIEHNDDLKLLLSPKKNRSAKHVLKRKSEIVDARKSKRVSSGLDILQQLQVHMKDPLDKELGFSLKGENKTASNSSSSRDFNHLLDEVKREREIKEILSIKEKAQHDEEVVSDDIQKWIRSNVFSNFLDIENGGIKVHGKWTSQLTKALKTIVSKNSGSFDVQLINSKILDNPQYGVIKSFTSRGRESTKWKDVSFLFDEYSIQGILESLDVKFVESFLPSSGEIIVEETYKDLKAVLSALGFDFRLVLDGDKPLHKIFDDKCDLPSLGCGFQVYKFIKIINTEKCSCTFPKREIFKTLVLMSVDCNVACDIQRYYYADGQYTGKEMAVMEIRKFKDDMLLVNDVLSSLFSENCPDVWFKLINNVEVSNTTADKIFASKLILRFLKENDVKDNVEIYDEFEALVELDKLFTIFSNFLKDMSEEHFRLEDENLSDLVYMKVELIKEMVIINHEVTKRWKHGTVDSDRLKELRSSILRIKNSYFREYENNFNPIIPKCRKVLDFLYHELSGLEVGDFFVENNSSQSKQF